MMKPLPATNTSKMTVFHAAAPPGMRRIWWAVMGPKMGPGLILLTSFFILLFE
ncbi:hypothetical protein ACS0TY_003250 [Phlomoides rotata]